MGANTSWIITRGKTKENILETLSLRVESSLRENEQATAIGSTFPGGWYVIAAKGYGHPLTENPNLCRLSQGCEVIAGGAETHVMACNACGWKDGKELWWLELNPEEGIYELQSGGNLPETFAAIYKKLNALQKNDSDVDHMFTVAEELTHALTGYHYDQSTPGEIWETLVPASAWRLWLGKIFK